MDIDFLIEDDVWLAVPEHQALARRAIMAIFELLERPVPQAELSIVFTSDSAVAELNRTWRGNAQPTNVLSFPAAAGPGPAPGVAQPGVPQPLGDIVLAAGVVSAEASAQGKPLANHTTHLIVHGVLHLLGYDHADEAHAEAMEALESEVMARLGLPDPYEDAQAPGRLQARPVLLDER